MKELYLDFHAHINRQELVRRVEELTAIEMGQTFRHYRMSAEYILAELKKNGIPNAQIVKFSADGKTVYQDKRMPVAWDATIGRLTLCDAEQTVTADYEKHPFHLIKGSVSTRTGGEILRIITEQQFLAGEDPRNTMVMLEPETWPRAKVLTPILDQGGRGIVTDFLRGRYQTPDAVQWVNACTEGANWHVQCDDRDFIGFSVSPRMGDQIRRKANAGSLMAKVECDGRRYEEELPCVTALVPGRRKEEIWLLAHTFEPLLDDDSGGVSAGIEIARQILSTGMPEYSLRLVFAMELYGFAAFHTNFKGKVVGGCNIDSLPLAKGNTCKLLPAGPAVPFHGNEILKRIADEFKDILPVELSRSAYFDDMFMSDPTIGVPTVWFLKTNSPFWHNSHQTEKGYIDSETFTNYTALAAVWFYTVLHYTGPLPEKVCPILKPISSPWRDHAEKQIYARSEAGFPQDLARVPKKERISLPDGMIYGPFANLLANMDGRKNLAELILEAEAETGTVKTEAEIKKYIDAVNFLADYGYLKVVRRPEISGENIAAALKALGVTRSDVLLVHASTSKCGYIAGGAETVIKSVASSAGTALFTTFTRPYIYLGGLNKSYNYRPFDPADYDAVWTGAVGKTILKKFPEAVRSRHITHSWAGLGDKVHACLGAHGACDAPAGGNSPMGKALEMGGKILYFGTGLAPTTFLHYLEDSCDMPFLDAAVCRVKNPDGSLKTVLIEKHLPGHRDFYRNDAENCKFFRRAIAAGLEIRSVDLGMGKLQLIDLQQLFSIGTQLLKADPRVLLCDEPGCLFCSKY